MARKFNRSLIGFIGGSLVALGLAAFWFWPAPGPVVPTLAEIVVPEAGLWEVDSGQPPGQVDLSGQSALELTVVDDQGSAVEPGQCAVSSDGKSWTPYHEFVGAVIRFPQPTSSVFLFVAATGHLSRVALLSGPGPVVLPRLPQARLQVDNGLGVGFGECQIEVSLKQAAFPDAGLRLPLVAKGQTQLLVKKGQSLQLKTQPDAKILLEMAMPYWTYTARVTGGPTPGAMVDFSAEPGEKLTVRVPFGGGPFIVGRIVGENGAPVEGANIRFSKTVNRGGVRVYHQMAATITGPDGRFLLAPQFPQDRLDEDLRFEGGGWLNVTVGEGQSGRSVQRQVDVAGNITDLGDVVLGSGLTVSGRVFVGDRPGASVRLDIWTEGGVFTTTSDESGYFSMSGLEAHEKLAITVSEKGYLPVNQNVLAEAVAGKQLEIRLRPLEHGSLRVEGSTELLRQAVLRWRLRESKGWKAAELRGQGVRQLEPGSYEVYLCTDDQISATETIEITDSTEILFKPVLFPAAKIVVTARKTTGPVQFEVADGDGHSLGFRYEVASAGTRVIVVRPDVPHTIKSAILNAPLEVSQIAAGGSFQAVLEKSP